MAGFGASAITDDAPAPCSEVRVAISEREKSIPSRFFSHSMNALRAVIAGRWPRCAQIGGRLAPEGSGGLCILVGRFGARARDGMIPGIEKFSCGREFN